METAYVLQEEQEIFVTAIIIMSSEKNYYKMKESYESKIRLFHKINF